MKAFFLSVLVFAGTSIPKLTRPIIDEYHLLSNDEQASIEATIRQMHETGKVQMAVYIPKSLNGSDIEGFSMQVAEAWKLGKKGQDQGLLMVIAPAERKMRLEVGYGLEGDITDAFSKQVLDDTIRPYFKEGRFADGIQAGIERIAEKLNLGLESTVPPPTLREQRRPNPIPHIFTFLVFGFFMFIMFAIASGGRRRRGPGVGSIFWGGGGGGWGSGGGSSWGGGSSSGGYSGGGGGFGGGGASSGW